MAVQEEVAAKVGGCAEVASLWISVTKFGAGDTLYDAQKARRGVLRPVIIKTVRAIIADRTPGRGKVLYEDTFNGLWNEWDLIPDDQAVSLVEKFRLRRAKEAQEAERIRQQREANPARRSRAPSPPPRTAS